MYTNIPKTLSLSSDMVADIMAENKMAEYYEKKYFGTDTVAQLEKDTVNISKSGEKASQTEKKPSLKEKIINIWNGGGSKAAKVTGLLATILLLLKGKKSGEFLKKTGQKLWPKIKNIPSKIINVIKNKKAGATAAETIKKNGIKALPAGAKLLGLPAPKV